MMKTTGAGINVLLVHGAFVDASSWGRVIPLLQREGFHVLAVQNPNTSLAADITTTSQALASLSGPTILVGHSYGGAVTSNVQASNVSALVYIAAYAPDEGESVFDLNGKFPATPAAAHFVPSYLSGLVWIDPEAFPANVVQDIPESEARAVAAAEKPIALDCFSAKSGAPTWKNVPSWYMVSLNDRTLHTEAERFMAKRIGATTRELASSHASLVSHPQDVLEVILAAFEGMQRQFHPERLLSLSVLSTLHPVALQQASAEDPDQYHRLDYVRFFRRPDGAAEQSLLADQAARLRAAYLGRVPQDLVNENIRQFLDYFATLDEPVSTENTSSLSKT